MVTISSTTTSSSASPSYQSRQGWSSGRGGGGASVFLQALASRCLPPFLKGPTGHVILTLLATGFFLALVDLWYILNFFIFVGNNNNNNHSSSSGSSSSSSSSLPRLNASWSIAGPPLLDRPMIDHRPNDQQDKEPLIRLLQEAGITDLDADTLARLPTWSQVTALYGDGPVVVGLETCETFQQQRGDPGDHLIGTAGTFNTGTNLMAELLIANCHMPARMHKYGPQQRGVRWQVMWGKHTPVGDEHFRQTHRTYKDEESLQADHMFPAVTIRDPFKWMQSMCRHPYAADWDHDEGHCPSLIPTAEDLQSFPDRLQPNQPIPVTISYAEFTRQHASLVDFWNDWYHEYLNATFPRLLVRLEDLVFHPKETTALVCECAGGAMNSHRPFQYIVESAKRGKVHGAEHERTSYVDALVRYGTEQGRYDGYLPADLKYAQEHLDPRLMQLFGYRFPPPKDEIRQQKRR